MSDLSFQLNADDGHAIAVYHWPTINPRGVVHMLHGMAEHGGRYARLADALNNAGWVLVAHDHRGHGRSVGKNELRGHFADADGWQKVLGDVSAVQDWIGQQHPGLPRVLMGHSMGSFIALAWAREHSASLDGLLLSSTDMKPLWLYRVFRWVLKMAHWRRGGRGISPLIRALSFDAFAKKIKQRNTDYDWLSRDAGEVALYIDDPLCGHDCTVQLWTDMIGALAGIRATGTATLDAQLPVYMIAGDNDPMSDFGAGVRRLEKMLHDGGTENLRVDMYAGGRHELLNDTERDAVTSRIVDWLDQITRR